MVGQLSLQDMIAQIVAPQTGFAPAPVMPANVPVPRPRPINLVGPLGMGGAAPAPTPRPSPVDPAAPASSTPATQRPSLLKGPVGDYFADVAGGIAAAPQGGGQLAAFLGGLGGAVNTDKARQAALQESEWKAEDRRIAAEDRTYQRGRDAAADKRAEEEFGLTKRKTEAEIAKDERTAKNPLTPQVLLEIEERAAAFAKELGLYDSNSFMGPEDRAAAQAKVREYRQALREEIEATGELPDADVPAAAPAAPKDQSRIDTGTPPPPQPGHTEDGYEFLGGDPADPKSWRQVQ